MSSPPTATRARPVYGDRGVLVSDAPPTLLVCLNRGATSMPILRGNGVFCVNTLRAGDELIADTFAGRTKVARESRFDAGEWETCRPARRL